MRPRGWHDFVEVNEDGQIIGYRSYDWDSHFGVHDDHVSASPSLIHSHPNGDIILGDLNDEDGGDMIAVELVAGQTYTWSYRGSGEDGIVDPWLRLYAADGTTLIAEDDDGGLGRTSQITFTATETGTYYLNATSWYQVDPTAPDFQDNGDYTIVQWSPEAGHDAGATFATAMAIDVGTSYHYLETAGDQDMYVINLTAGNVYTFTYNGGVSSGADWDNEPGESIGVLGLYNSSGVNVVPLSVNFETSITFVAQESGTYYLRALGYDNFAGGPPMVGGYTIDIREESLADKDPLESLNWDSAANIPTVMVDGVPTAYVYFAPAGENFGELADDGVTPMTTYGWTQKEMDAVMLALEQYTPITGINYVITEDADVATFRLLTTKSTQYGAYFYPQAPNYGDAAGIGVFNVDSGGWDKPGVSNQDIPGDQVSLEQGGFAFAVILHEFGHGHGIAHPHDTGGGSEIMLGVTASSGSYGLYNLNQGVYTVMSYNDAWDFHPDGPSSFTIAGIDNGWSGTLGAFDIAVLQARYGEHAYNTGDDVYMLTDVADDAFYQTIWDSGGNDTIAYDGTLNAQIDLLAATLDYSPTGGGVISFLYNVPGTPASQQVKGGYTIANGVVIENATGGSGDDILLGNSAINVLTGNAGDDVLMGREGNDLLLGGDGDDIIYGGDGLDVISLGAGNDVFVAEITETKVNLKGPNKGSMSVDIITDFNADGDDLIDLSELGSFTFNGTNANKKAGDLTYKTFDSVNGAEKALGIDIDGHDGAGGISGPVTVVYGNTDGGAADFAIILLNTSSVSADDFIFAEASTAALSGTSHTSRNSDIGNDLDSPFRPLGLMENSFISGLHVHEDYIIA